jgi:hypothetical protein
MAGEESGLAGTVGADKHDELARVQGEAHSLNRPDRVGTLPLITVVEIPDLDERRHTRYQAKTPFVGIERRRATRGEGSDAPPEPLPPAVSVA